MYLGIDLGTSGLKALLIDSNQRVVGLATAPLSVNHPHSGWSEQYPAIWVQATSDALDGLMESHPKDLAAVKGIGLSGQMHGATLLDRSAKVLRPCMLWNDTRSHAEAAKMDLDPAFRDITGNIVFPGFTAPKIKWLQRNEPNIFQQIDKVLLPKDYLRFWLTGEYVSDMSDASGTSWLDVKNRRWSDGLLAKSDLSSAHMPSLVEGTEISGYVQAPLAERWGMSKDVAVAGGAGDNAASAIGLGIVNAGAGFVSLGTSGVVFAATDTYLPSPDTAVHTFCHALPNTWHQMGVILAATDALNWWARICKTGAAELTAEIDTVITGPESTVFLPYLSGERTPHNDADVRGSFHNLSMADSRASITKSILEGVAFTLRDALDALRSTGTKLQSVLAVGGGTQSTAWLDILANILDIPIEIPKGGDIGAAFGAARLGLIASENISFKDCCQKPDIARVFEPHPDTAHAYAEKHRVFKALYQKSL
ncbi:xylulokinase [Parasulfitobacter algicola]|uniref:Xylulose kinase n=1 Tax=Parasulfitobacter algicola TaxID=2614809 RepID=A0ABX2ISA7_9RHOB|nr:xylulokinase [Sulfitobacter algicola]NSX55788.1 xylulokinase [Sulfitobacter algicola]